MNDETKIYLLDEPEVGEIFQVNNHGDFEFYETVKNNERGLCKGCCFYIDYKNEYECEDENCAVWRKLKCSKYNRKDKTNVIFKRVKNDDEKSI